MSRRIDLDKPLSDEDRQYLVDRADSVALERNAAAVAGAEFDGSPDGDDDDKSLAEPKALEDQNVEELKQSIRDYNMVHDADHQLLLTGTKDELLARLIEVAEPQ